MNVMIVSGSRNPQGQTGQAIEAIVQGASNGGCQCEVIWLPKLKLARCQQCDDAGWGKCRSEGRCAVEDDFAGVAEKVKSADAVVFATPVYFSDLSESLRSFLDRLRRTCCHENGKARTAGKPVVGVCVAGGGGGGAPACAVHLEKILHNCAFDVVDMIPARRQNLAMKLEVLGTVGKWLALKNGIHCS